MPSGNGEKFTAVRPSIVFGLLQHSLLPLGYKLTESSRDRVGNVVAASVGRFWKKIQAITDGKRRKRIKAETWIKVGIKPDEVQCTPNHIMAELESDDNFLTKLYSEQRLFRLVLWEDFKYCKRKCLIKPLSSFWSCYINDRFLYPIIYFNLCISYPSHT